MIINLYKHRGYIFRTAWADVRHRYAGSAVGILWNVLQPLALITVFSIVFTEIIRRVVPAGLDVAYPVYLCSLLLPWMALSECLSRGTTTFVGNAAYLRRLPIPEQVFMAQTAASAAFGLLISFSLFLIVTLTIFRHPFTWHWLLLPGPLVLLLGMGFGAAMLLGTVHAFIRDTATVLQIILQVGFWSYPIVYHRDSLPEWMQRALPFNPVYPFFETIRGLLLHAQLPPPGHWAAMVAWSGGACIVGYVALRKLRPELRDVL
jgi:lipopolysaccharide transport system permease protein